MALCMREPPCEGRCTWKGTVDVGRDGGEGEQQTDSLGRSAPAPARRRRRRRSRAFGRRGGRRRAGHGVLVLAGLLVLLLAEEVLRHRHCLGDPRQHVLRTCTPCPANQRARPVEPMSASEPTTLVWDCTPRTAPTTTTAATTPMTTSSPRESMRMGGVGRKTPARPSVVVGTRILRLGGE